MRSIAPPRIINRTFQPGFRLSWLDSVVLAVAAATGLYAGSFDRWLGEAIGFVVMHFFLFCNILRMSRRLELIWAACFTGLAAARVSLDFISWQVVFAVSSVLTIILATIEARRPSYHGVGWRTLNPGLPGWWRDRLNKNVTTERRP